MRAGQRPRSDRRGATGQRRLGPDRIHVDDEQLVSEILFSIGINRNSSPNSEKSIFFGYVLSNNMNGQNSNIKRIDWVEPKYSK